MAQNATAAAPARARKTLTLKATPKADFGAPKPPEAKGASPLPAASKTKGAKRGRNVDIQLLQPGTVQANPGTVFGVIAALVTELGTVTRAGLVDAMGQAVFLNPKARPQDRAWCQGYVAGALRDGYLAAVAASPEAGDNAEK